MRVTGYPEYNDNDNDNDNDNERHLCRTKSLLKALTGNIVTCQYLWSGKYSSNEMYQFSLLANWIL
jgi:hypothetical protein